MVRTYAPSRLPTPGLSPYYSGTLPVRIRPPINHIMSARPRPQTGGDLWSDIDGFLRSTQILSKAAQPVLGLAGGAVGGLLGPLGGAAGGIAGSLAGDYAAMQLSQAGYGRRRRRAAPKRKAAPRKAAPKRKAPARKRK